MKRQHYGHEYKQTGKSAEYAGLLYLIAGRNREKREKATSTMNLGSMRLELVRIFKGQIALILAPNRTY